MAKNNASIPRVRIVDGGGKEGLKTAYRLLAKKIMEERFQVMEEKPHAVRNLCQGKH